jgi:transcriptional regulator EpsA
MPDLRLNDLRRHQFSEVVEGALRVDTRQQFFSWLQGPVQGLVPHEVLVCGLRGASGARLDLQQFSASRYFGLTQLQALAPAQGGLVQVLQTSPRWAQEVLLCLSPVASDPVGQSPSRGAAADPLSRLVWHNELKNLAARLLPAPDGGAAACFAFGRLDHPLDACLQHAVELVVPHLHQAYARVLHHERGAAPTARPVAESLVTLRQQEILSLVKLGKTNDEIASVLSCSPWTVKNHVQNILRRLGTSSRAHAVARAISLGILQPD